MSKRVANHLHRYKKIDLGRDDKEYLVYRCMKPACSHYIPVHLAENQIVECNKCHEPMLITKATLTHSGGKPMAKPHCGNCVKSKKSETVDALADFLKEKGL